MVKYPSLYKIVRKKNKSVVQVLSTTPLNVSFRRALVRVQLGKMARDSGEYPDGES
jgi:hypothetical protein